MECVKKKRISGPLMQFTLSYLGVIIILVLVALSTVLSTRQIYEDNAVQSNRIILDHTVQSIDNSLETTLLFNNSLLSNRNVANVLGRQDRVSITDIAQTATNLPYLTDANKLTMDYYLYSIEDDIILAPNQAFLNVDLYYNTHFKLGDLKLNEWKELLRQGSNETIMIPIERNATQSPVRNTILLLTPYTNLNTGKSLGCAAYFISSDGIHSLLTANSQITDISYLVSNKSGTVLLSQGEIPEAHLTKADENLSVSKKDTFRTNEILYTYHHSAKYDLTYAIGVQQEYFVMQSWQSARPQIIVILLLLLASLCIVILFFWSNLRPLRSVIRRLYSSEAPNQIGSKNNLWALDAVAGQLMISKDRLETEIKQREIERKNILIDRFLQGNSFDTEELLGVLKKENPAFQAKGIRACLVELDFPNAEISREEISLHMTQVLLELQRHSEMTFVKQRDNQTLMFLFNANQNLNEYPIFRDVRNHFNDAFKFYMRFCIGYECRKIENVHYSFLAAERLMSLDFDGRFLLIHDSIYQSSDQYFYTHQTEQKLKLHLSNGKQDEALVILDQVYTENFELHHLLPVAQQKLFFGLVGTLYEFDEIISVDSLLTALRNDLIPEIFFTDLKAYCSSLCTFQQKKAVEHHAELVDSILTYISDNMSDPDMSLSLLSIKFGMTEKYISAYIKEKTDITFSAHLEKLRLSKANDLLLKTDMSIKQISVEAGYMNVNSFRRWYQRLQGVSPSSYRNSVGEGLSYSDC